MKTRWAVTGGAALLIAACSTSDIAGPAISLREAAIERSAAGLVTGTMHSVDPGGEFTSAAVHAVRMPDGTVRGTFEIRRHLGPLGGAKVHGRMLCMVIVGNQAWLAGVIEKAVNPANVGKLLGFRAVDNGEGSGSVPDQWGRVWDVPSAAEYCSGMPGTTLTDLVRGNLQVRGE